MASKEAKKASRKFLNSPLGTIVLIIAIIAAVIKLIFG